MSARFQGLLSTSLVMVAVILAAVAAFLRSWVLGVGYLALCALALTDILYAFCAKCPCRLHSGHVLPRKLVSLFVSREPGPYSRLEIGIVAVALLLLLGLPQAWLWRYAVLLFGFWLLAIFAVVEIRAFVCRACDNAYCPAGSQGSAHPSSQQQT